MSIINPTARVGAMNPPATTFDPAKQVAPAKGSFGDLLNGLVQNVSELQANAGELRNQLITGEGGELHQAMIAAEEAGLAMELLIEVRNKLVEAYQQLMRMPV